MLVAGVVLGLVLGPTVLGQFAPQFYDPMFVGSGDTAELDAARADLDDFKTNSDRREAKINEIIAQYKLVGSDDDSIAIAKDEQLVALTNAFADEQEALEQVLLSAQGEVTFRRQAHLDKLSGMATVILLLVVLLFAAEAIVSPQRDEIEDGQAELSPLLSRLVTVRYGLMAGWLILMLAQPHWLSGIDPWFGGLLLLVVVVAGLVPLGKRASN